MECEECRALRLQLAQANARIFEITNDYRQNLEHMKFKATKEFLSELDSLRARILAVTNENKELLLENGRKDAWWAKKLHDQKDDYVGLLKTICEE